ncbi:MAG: tetratricopeptide repeat protein, partial [Myxococcota bacterium]
MHYRVITTAVLLSIVGAGSAHAQEEEEKKQNFVCRPQVYDRLVKAQKALSENNYKDAEEKALKIQRRIRLNDHEKALVMQTLGYIYAGQERLKLAAKTLTECYDLHSLPAATQVSMLFNIGQIHMANKDFKSAVRVFNVWLTKAKKPKPSALYTIAAANYQIKDFKAAIRHSEAALKQTKKPKDALLQLLLSAYVETKKYRSAIRIISIIVERHPDRKNNWLQLAALYGEVGDEKRALAVMELAKDAGALKKSDEYVQLSQRLLAEEIPWEAAKLLETSMKDGTVETNADNSKLIATAWLQSRNLDKAAPALEAAAKLAKDGDLYVRLAQLELERERWKQAISASEKALKKGGLKSK